MAAWRSQLYEQHGRATGIDETILSNAVAIGEQITDVN
jgi:hypothetical protein